MLSLENTNKVLTDKEKSEAKAFLLESPAIQVEEGATSTELDRCALLSDFFDKGFLQRCRKIDVFLFGGAIKP